jgi:predicted O-methyltransferase YrrM
MNRGSIIGDYINYYFRSRTKYSVHSPFVFEFITTVLDHKKVANDKVLKIESLRKELLSFHKEIEVKDFGAGSSLKNTHKKKVSDIVRHSAKSRKYANLLYRIEDHYQIRNVLELGTSAGLTSLYLAAPSCVDHVLTLEGCPETAKLAEENFKRMNAANLRVINGNFDDLLSEVLAESRFDLIFFDGNHTEEATIRYFEQCLPAATNDSIFIFDDINWSDGMKNAWNRIKENPAVTVTVDLFFLGIVFFRKELSKEDFVIRF